MFLGTISGIRCNRALCVPAYKDCSCLFLRVAPLLNGFTLATADVCFGTIYLQSSRHSDVTEHLLHMLLLGKYNLIQYNNYTIISLLPPFVVSLCLRLQTFSQNVTAYILDPSGLQCNN